MTSPSARGERVCSHPVGRVSIMILRNYMLPSKTLIIHELIRRLKCESRSLEVKTLGGLELISNKDALSPAKVRALFQ